jgi:translation initiation factor 1
MAKKKIITSGIIYSTDPDFQVGHEEEAELETLASKDQQLRIRLETKHRAGKAVTTVNGFVGKQQDLEELGRKLKTFCGTGGSVKDGEIIVQGDNRDKILQWMQKNGFSKAKKI